MTADAQGTIQNLDGGCIPDYADPDEPPFIVAQRQPDRLWPSPSAPLVLWVNARGAPFLVYRWKLYGTNIVGPFGTYTNLAVFFGSSEERHYTCEVSNAAGVTNSQTWKARALIEGAVAAWGSDNQGQLDWPVNATNLITVAAGGSHSLAAREDGSVIGWGLNDSGQTNAPTLTGAFAVAAGNKHSLALRDNRTVVAWGRSTEGQTHVPSGLTNVIAVAAGGNQSMALLNNKTVTNWGYTFGTIPTVLTNAIAVAAGTNFCLALRSGGTIVAWGDSGNGQTNVPASATNVVAIAAGDFHALALKENGTVVAWGANGSGQTNVPSGLSNVMAVAAGRAHSVALKNDGTVAVWGDNNNGQTNIGAGLKWIKSIAAGGDHTLAAVFSTFVQYQVDVSKDLLLLYNTTSSNSIAVKDYYLAHRPMVSNANVLGISCPTNEIISGADFTNQFLNPMLNWLTANPTKRPQYVILFPDFPSTHSSVISSSVSLHESVAWIRPFVTSINMRTTNDCRAYINKLKFIGTNYSPGKVVISASGNGTYGNTNYYFDNAVVIDPESTQGTLAKNGVIQNGASPSAVIYAAPTDAHITLATNVTGYLTWGSHGGQGAGFATNGTVVFTGNSRWYVIETIESYNGKRDDPSSNQSNFLNWFSQSAFGGANYSCTPVGAVSHVYEPGGSGWNDPAIYFGLWQAGKSFGASAWNSRRGPRLQAVGDPLVKK